MNTSNVKSESIENDFSVQMQNEISVIEQNHHNEILAIHENMQQLVNDCISIEVHEDDKKSYDTALELKRVVKATHVAIEKKRKELKQPLIDYGKRLDKWVEEIYTPLVNAEKIVKKKMEVYEAKQEKLKLERKLAEEKQKQEEVEMEVRLKELNNQLPLITNAKSKAEIHEIENYLDSINLSDFGAKSGEAGFILNQLKLTCSLAYRAIKDDEETPVEETKLDSTPITDDLLNELKESPSSNVYKFPTPSDYVPSDETIEENSSLDETIEQQEYLEVDDEVKSDSEITSINNETEIKEDIIEFSDEEIISTISDFTDSFLNNAEVYIAKQFSQYVSAKYDCELTQFNIEHLNYMTSEVIKRIGFLLTKNK